MSRFNLETVGRAVLSLSLILTVAAELSADDSSRLRAQFDHPPRQYASGPLWVWNDMLTDEQIVSTLEDLAGQKVKQVFVHPRPGLMTPYLSDEWFRLWKVALAAAERLDMNVWIYDENSYPSGFAGGLVPEAMPEARGKGLDIREVKQTPKPADDIVAVFQLTDAGYQNLTEDLGAGKELPAGRYLVASIRLAPTGGWFGGKYYVDLLRPGVTEKFLEITMEAYRQHLGDQFGKRVPGVFTDEPHLAPARGLHWSDHLPELFQRRWGYSLVDHLPCLVRPVGDWKRVRHNYYLLLLEQFIDRWARPFYEYCEKHGLEFTGHYWEHGWPGAGHGGDNMAMYAWHQRPAIDTLMNRYSEDVHAQFGNVRAVLELASVANQLGRQRTLCEAYGAGGWDLRFEDMKRIGDWLYVLGVNTLDEHLSYITIRGARKRDHPQSFSYHEPWWDAYHVMAEYFTRLSLALSAGEQVNHILLLEPTSTTWMYQATPDLKKIGDEFQALVTTLAKEQIELDLGCEDIMGRHGSVDGANLVIGKRRYQTLVLPPRNENLDARTLELLETYLAAGGTVLSCSPPPERVDGSASDRGQALAKYAGFKQIDLGDLVPALQARCETGFSVRRVSERGILFHHRRRLEDGEILFLVNTCIESPCKGKLSAVAKGIERWDAQTGKIAPFAFESDSQGVKADFALPPCGSLLLFLTKGPRQSQQSSPFLSEEIAAKAPLTVRRLGPNVLPLDYVDITAGGETRKGLYFYRAAKLAFQKNGAEGNPWERAVQFRDELISKTFPPESGFEASYRFTIQGAVPQPLFVVIERPDLYRVACNDKPVTARKGEWWLDKSFGKIDVSSLARTGENAVTIKASPMTVYHELEPAYVLGDFAVQPTESGFVIVPDCPLQVQQQLVHDDQIEGTMWLSSGVGYRHDPASETGNDRDPFVVFDLGKACALSGIKVWNYNEVNLPGRGVNKLVILGSADGTPDSFTIPIGTFELAPAPGSAKPGAAGQMLSARAAGVRFVKFDILSNHTGTTFPVKKAGTDRAFVGLSEVRFYAAAGKDALATELSGVKIHAVSSELLGGHNRRAQFLIDDSGLGLGGVGWNGQGAPFYGGGVAYAQTFDLGQPKGRYVVSLGEWLGSVAKVQVNGQLAGHITCQPWECEVTKHIKPGSNRIEVIVIGTLRNTLGPHHSGPMVGSAWPAMFQKGPENGPPPGRAYHTLGYGLFEPFSLRSLKPASEKTK